MNVVGRVGSLISQGVTTVASPFHPFGGAVDIIVVQREDGTYRTTPWCVRFGKFQGVLKVSEKIVTISVNGVDANFHMYLDNSGEAYFLKEVESGEDSCQQDEDLVQNVEKGSTETGIIDVTDDAYEEKNQMVSGRVTDLQMARQEVNNDEPAPPLEGFIDEQALDENKEELLSTSSSFHYESVIGVQPDDDGSRTSQSSDSEVVLMTVDGHLISAPVSSFENTDNVQLSTPQFYLVPEEDSGMEVNEVEESTENMDSLQLSTPQFCLVPEEDSGIEVKEVEESTENMDNVQLRSTPQFYPVSEEGSGVEINEVEETTDYRGVYVESCAERSPEKPIMEHCEQSPCSVQEFTTSSSDSLHEDVIVNNDTRSSSTAEICVPIVDRAGHVEIECNGGDCAEFCDENFQSDPDESVAMSAVDSYKDQEDLSSSCLDPSELSKHIENDNSGNLHVALETTHCSFIDEKNNHAHKDDFDKDEAAEVRSENEAPTSDIGETEEVPTAVSEKNSRSAQDNASNGAPGNVDTSESQLKISPELAKYGLSRSIEISLCGNLLHANMGIAAAAEAFEAHQISEEEFKASGASIIKDKNLIIRCKEKYLPWEKAAAIILAMVAFGMEFPSDTLDAIPVEQDEISRLNSQSTSLPSRGWRFWSIPFRRVKTLEQSNSNPFTDEVSMPSEPTSESPDVKIAAPSNSKTDSPRKQLMRTNIPTSEQIASLNLKDGQNVITFSFCTRVLGKQQVDARIYLWKSNARIVISDVDGTITKSDVLGQFMPLVGRDWSQSGVARLFSAIKENGYQLLFLSARAIVQAYLTRNFLHNLKQDGKALPNGPVLISPDGLSYSFIREVVRRKPHEFKIACLEEIRALFPSDYNPFYAGFGNRDTDELSYRKIGIPKGKIFIINPKGEVAIDNCVDSRSYCSLHTLVNDMFPPTSLREQEDFNNWNYWKMPFISIED